jgi:type II restriction/modification system DNA methylase subunit YeeA
LEKAYTFTPTSDNQHMTPVNLPFKEAITTAKAQWQQYAASARRSAYNWSGISTEIFGSLFQEVLTATERRSLGAHYTSEKNILRLIEPLFLDELREEFKAVRKNEKKLAAFRLKLHKLRFLDPACGCGNFLVVTYRELRLLDLEVVRANSQIRPPIDKNKMQNHKIIFHS